MILGFDLMICFSDPPTIVVKNVVLTTLVIMLLIKNRND